jgi:hypothetical protein
VPFPQFGRSQTSVSSLHTVPAPHGSPAEPQP